MSQTASVSTGINHDTESLDKFQKLEKWLLDNGGSFPKLYLKDYGNEVRGCHTRLDIHDEECIIDIPLKCLITVEMGKDTEIGKALLANNIELDAPKHIFLMLYMLIDRKDPDSFFKPYYDVLPPTLSNMPIFWHEDELRELKGSYILEQIAERNVCIKDDYNSICEIAPSFKSIATLEDFKWARMCVCSRNFGLVINNVKTAALVPYADMLNHYRPRETKWQFEDVTQSFRVVALQTISAGSQVYDSYGQKCNHRFLLNYGFSVEKNVEIDGFCPNEVLFEIELKSPQKSPMSPLSSARAAQFADVELIPIGADNGSSRPPVSPIAGRKTLFSPQPSLPISEHVTMQLYSHGSLELFDAKVNLWRRENTTLTRRLRVCVGHIDNDQTKILLASLRIIVADEIDYFPLVSHHILNSYSSPSSSGSSMSNRMSTYKSIHNAVVPISIQNESLMLKALKYVCQYMLSKYPTSLEQDQIALSDANIQNLPIYSNKRHATIHVRGEKEVLHFYNQLAVCGLRLLNISENELMEYQAVLDDIKKNQHKTIVDYCENYISILRQHEFLRNQKLLEELDLTQPIVV